MSDLDRKLVACLQKEADMVERILKAFKYNTEGVSLHVPNHDEQWYRLRTAIMGHQPLENVPTTPLFTCRLGKMRFMWEKGPQDVHSILPPNGH